MGGFDFSLYSIAFPDLSLQPIRVAPEAYYLFDAAAVGVPELCDAFKVRLVCQTGGLVLTLTAI